MASLITVAGPVKSGKSWFVFLAALGAARNNEVLLVTDRPLSGIKNRLGPEDFNTGLASANITVCKSVGGALDLLDGKHGDNIGLFIIDMDEENTEVEHLLRHWLNTVMPRPVTVLVRTAL